MLVGAGIQQEEKPIAPYASFLQLVQSIYAATAKSPESFENSHVHLVGPHSECPCWLHLVSLSTVNSFLCSLAMVTLLKQTLRRRVLPTYRT